MRVRPPNISLSTDKSGPRIEFEPDSPLHLQLSDDDDDDDDDDFQDTLQLSSSDSSGSNSPVDPTVSRSLKPPHDLGAGDELSKDLAALQQLRKSVQTNLRLRPIRSRSNLPKVDISDPLPIPKSPLLSKAQFMPTIITTPVWHDALASPESASSAPSSSIESYFTPIAETPYTSQFIGPITPGASPIPTASSSGNSPLSPKRLYDRLCSMRRPLLIDTRPPATHHSFHIRHSINIAIPSLILKRCRKPAGGFQNLDALRQFITSDKGRESWDGLMSPGGPWDGDIVIYDDEMNVKDKDNVSVTAWALMPVLMPLLSHGSVDYLEGGISSAGHDPDLETLIISGDEPDSTNDDEAPQQSIPSGITRKSSGLFQLDTQSATRSKPLPEIEPSSSTSSNPPSPLPLPRSPLPLMPAGISNSSVHERYSSPSNSPNVLDLTPSPPPSSIGFRRPLPPNRPSIPNLRRLDTRSVERLGANVPKLSVRTKPLRSATLTVPPTLSLSFQAPTSPSHLNLKYSTHSPPSSAQWTPTSPSNDPSNYLSAYFTPPHTPGTPKFQLPPSPQTARPDLDQPPTTEEEFLTFTISTILPNFLYLGPEPTTTEHMEELQDLGVRRILNIAAECDDDQGLRLKEVFERYNKIPMRDTVEEDNMARGVREVCDILDDARLHSAPTYVHCKAGKSRSVTAVMAYLIHANHWTLSRAYAFVLERRKGISPNIGFVSELMTFEEQELGGKSIGVQPSGPGGGVPHDGPGGGDNSYVVSVGGNSLRRGAHIRESLPPALGGHEGMGGTTGGPMSAGGLMERVFGDSGQEMEIKDSSGRYRHARRAPVNETTLQPMRRVSKAGLESSACV